MTNKQAIWLAIKTMESEIQTIAFLANLYDKLGEYNIPAAKSASEKRKKLYEAIEVLRVIK